MGQAVLDRNQLYAELTGIKPRLQARIDRDQGVKQNLLPVRDWFRTVRRPELEAQLEASGVVWPGARPTCDMDRADGFRIAGPVDTDDFQSIAGLFGWADGILRRRAVLAVDGSHLVPERGMSLTLGAIQIGWHLNDPLAGRAEEYQDISLQLSDKYGSAEHNTEFVSQINLARSVKECETLLDKALAMAHTPVCFYDNSYIASFLAYQTDEFRDRYLGALDTLLTRAEAAQIPVVGYIDASDSRDLVHMYGSVHDQATLDDSDLYGITDAALVAELLPGWGDRTPLMQCARHDGVSCERGPDFLYGRVGIVYLRLHRRTLPARVEIPLWIWEREGLLEEVMDVVRAQVVLGNMSYPRALSRADRQATLSTADRRVFYNLVKSWANQELGQNVTRSAKANSKRVTRPSGTGAAEFG